METINYTGKAWKHHIAEDFTINGVPTHPNGAGKGGTIFLDFYFMCEYLKSDGRDWFIADLELVEEPLLLEFNSKYMANTTREIDSKRGFYKFN